MSEYPTKLTAAQVNVGDDVKREYSPEYRQQPWGGIVLDVLRAERPDGTELRQINVWTGRQTDEHFMELDAPIMRIRTGFVEPWGFAELPFNVNLTKCTLCGSIIEGGEERTHTGWHIQLLRAIHLASQDPDPRLWSQH